MQATLAQPLEEGAPAPTLQHYASSGGMHDNRTISSLIPTAPLISGRPSVKLLMYSNSRGRLTIDLVSMKEVDPNNDTEKDVVTEISLDQKALRTNIFAWDRSGRYQFLSLIVEKLRHEDYVRKFSEENAGSRQIISYRSNPFMSTQHSLYTSFLKSFEEAIEWNQEGFGKLFDKILHDQYLDDKLEEDDMVILCFHGTNHEWMDSIMQNGMDCSLRRSSPDMDWFATRASTSIEYTTKKTSTALLSREGIKLLVFLLVKEVSSTIDNGVITICSSRNQLPVGEVTLR